MEETPDTPIPPSPEVLEATARDEHRNRVKWLKRKHWWTWMTIAFTGLFLNGLLSTTSYAWFLAPIASVWIILTVYTNTRHADRLYQSAYAAGLSMGIIAGRETERHVMAHLMAHGDEMDCHTNGGVQIKAQVPHMWEHPIVREQISSMGAFEFVDEEDHDDDDGPETYRGGV